MKLDRQYWRKLAAYMSGNLRDEEKASFEKQRYTSFENKKTFNEGRQIWEKSGLRLQLNNEETDQEWQKLKSRIENESEGGKLIQLINNRSLWMAAAAVVFLIVTIYLFIPSNEAIIPEASERLVTLSSGDKVATFYLPDSSKVWLNAGSTLTYSESYGKELRATQISGEGYFQVRPDTMAPFTVNTELALVRVLGTSFNVKEGPEGVVLTVAEGTVSFASSKASADQKVKVTAAEKAIITDKGDLSKSENNDPDFAAWREKNNPIYENERNNPPRFINNDYSWRKNKLNLSVIEGALKNNAELAAYANIVLKISYTKPNGKVSTTELTIAETVAPGKTISYQKRLLDIFTDTRKVKVEVQSAEVVRSTPN